MTDTLAPNSIVGVLKNLTEGGNPKKLRGGLILRRYGFHGMSELVVWRDEGVEPSAKELEIVEDAIRLLCAPGFILKTPSVQRSGHSLAYRFFWPTKKGGLRLLAVQRRLELEAG